MTDASELTMSAAPGPVGPARTNDDGGRERVGERPALHQRLRHAAPAWSGVAVVLLAMVVAVGIAQPVFTSSDNVQNILASAAIPLTLAIGTTFLLTIGIIDLSIGALVALASTILAGITTLALPGWLCVLATCAAVGLISAGVTGVLITKVRLSFFVVTLGTLGIFTSIAQLPNSGETTQLYDRAQFATIAAIGDGTLLGLPTPAVIAFALLVLAILILRFTTFGHAIFAVGGNPDAARLAGIAVDRVRLSVFAINGLLCGLAAVMLCGRAQSASSAVDPTLALNVIAAALLGGSSFLGGASTMVGTALGTLFIVVLQNALNLVGVAVFWQGVVTGSVLILAVWLDRIRAGRG